MIHEQLEDTIPLYAVGALEREERQATESHLLSGCVSCHSALKEYQSVAALLPFGLNLMTPPRKLKTQIMAARTPAIDQDTADQQPGKPRLRPGEWMNHLIPPEASAPAHSVRWIMGLAIALVLVSGGYMARKSYTTLFGENTAQLAQLQDEISTAHAELVVLQQQLNERDTALTGAREELGQRVSDIAELKDQLIQREAELEIITDQLTQQGGRAVRTPQDELAALLRTPTTKTILLAGTGMNTLASGILLYDAHTQKAWLYALHLPACPSGMTYQLWARHDKPTSIGTFAVHNGETSHVFAASAPGFLNAKTFSVSLEPIAGHPQPTGPVYLLSQL